MSIPGVHVLPDYAHVSRPNTDWVFRIVRIRLSTQEVPSCGYPHSNWLCGLCIGLRVARVRGSLRIHRALIGMNIPSWLMVFHLIRGGWRGALVFYQERLRVIEALLPCALYAYFILGNLV